MKTSTTHQSNQRYESIELGIDANAKWYYVGRHVDGATPQTFQKMNRLFIPDADDCDAGVAARVFVFVAKQ